VCLIPILAYAGIGGRGPFSTIQDLASPGPIGGTTPAAGTFTDLSATGTLGGRLNREFATVNHTATGSITDAANDDFTLQAGSPCINAGTNPFSDGDWDQTDMKGRLIWSDGPNSADSPVGPWADGVDIGAYGDDTGPAAGL